MVTCKRRLACLGRLSTLVEEPSVSRRLAAMKWAFQVWSRCLVIRSHWAFRHLGLWDFQTSHVRTNNIRYTTIIIPIQRLLALFAGLLTTTAYFPTRYRAVLRLGLRLTYNPTTSRQIWNEHACPDKTIFTLLHRLWMPLIRHSAPFLIRPVVHATITSCATSVCFPLVMISASIAFSH